VRVAPCPGAGADSVWPVGVCLVVCGDRVFRDGAVAAEFEADVERPGPDRPADLAKRHAMERR
jgi:hypothetical protein